MCGIAGAFGDMARIQVEAVANKIIQEIRYRGPDAQGVERFDNGFFVHLRLSIIDLTAGGAQPKWSADGRLCITYNGEIYNYKELKAELAAAGHAFTTDSDTEVLLKVWEAWGPAGLKRCIGMFAFGIFDIEKKKVYLARDMYGIKPLYITDTGKGMRFASTFSALSCFPDCSRRVNAARVFEFARYGLLDYQCDTLVEGVRALKPGTVETWDVSGNSAKLVSTSQADSPVYRQRAVVPSFDQAAEELRETFLASVRLHLRSDVPLGFALSGGIDSSAIVCAARMLEPDADLNTFTYVATGSAVDESPWARLVSDHVRARPHHVFVDGKSAFDLLGDLVRTHGTPTASMSPHAAFVVHRAAREAGITVMLNGQGADETFGGYFFQIGAALAGYIRRGDLMNAAKLFRAGGKLSRMKWWTIGAWSIDHLLPGEFKTLARRISGFEHIPDWIDARWVEQRIGRSTASLGPKLNDLGSDVLGGRLAHDLNELTLPGILLYEDRNSMHNSIESRVPFLAAPLTELAFSVPSDYHIGPDGVSKRLLRAALRDILPEEIRLRRDKIGFEVPQAPLLLQEAGQIEVMLNSDVARSIKLFNHDKILSIWRSRDRLSERDFNYVWRWISLIKWTETFDIQWN